MGDERIDEEMGGLSAAQLRAIDALVGGATMTAAAEKAGVGRTTLYRWQTDARFREGLNRAKLDHRAEVRGELRALAAQAIQTLRDLLASEQSAPALRVKIAMGILETVGVRDAERIAPPRLEPEPPQRTWPPFNRPGPYAPSLDAMADR